MSRPKRNNKDVPVNLYEQHRNEQIEINNQRLEALNLPRMNSSGQNVQPSKRKVLYRLLFMTTIIAYFLTNIYTIMCLFCRELNNQVMQQLKVTICAGHKEIVLKMQMSRLKKILSISQLKMQMMEVLYSVTCCITNILS
jgi:hypothetical protein